MSCPRPGVSFLGLAILIVNQTYFGIADISTRQIGSVEQSCHCDCATIVSLIGARAKGVDGRVILDIEMLFG